MTKLQKYYFRTLKESDMINCLKEFELDLMNTFCVPRVLRHKVLQRIYELISAFSTRKFSTSLKSNFSLKITSQKPEFSLITTFHKFFQFSESIQDLTVLEPRRSSKKYLQDDLPNQSKNVVCTLWDPLSSVWAVLLENQESPLWCQECGLWRRNCRAIIYEFFPFLDETDFLILFFFHFGFHLFFL